jgi:hypothetical protein
MPLWATIRSKILLMKLLRMGLNGRRFVGDTRVGMDGQGPGPVCSYPTWTRWDVRCQGELNRVQD